MNWQKKPLRKISRASAWISIALTWWLTAGCGVKGDPLPPEKPAELGRGRPTYRRATEGIKIEKRASERPRDEDSEEEDDEQEAD